MGDSASIFYQQVVINELLLGVHKSDDVADEQYVQKHVMAENDCPW